LSVYIFVLKASNLLNTTIRDFHVRLCMAVHTCVTSVFSVRTATHCLECEMSL
jgi:hypothetical protein